MLCHFRYTGFNRILLAPHINNCKPNPPQKLPKLNLTYTMKPVPNGGNKTIEIGPEVGGSWSTDKYIF